MGVSPAKPDELPFHGTTGAPRAQEPRTGVGQKLFLPMWQHECLSSCHLLRKILRLRQLRLEHRNSTIMSEGLGLRSDIQKYVAVTVVKRDSGQLVGAINQLLSDKERLAVVGANGRRCRAQDRYSSKAVGKELQNLYRQAASTKTRK